LEINMEEDNQGFLDKILTKITSRKFLVFLLATTFLIIDKIQSQDWLWISAIYIGTSAAANTMYRFITAKTGKTCPATPEEKDDDVDA